MSLLTLIQDAADLLGITRPATVVNNPDQQVRTLYALANEEGADLQSAYNWQALTAEFTFTTAAQQLQTAFIPADFDRWVNNSFWNRTTRRNLLGPVSPQVWQALQAQPAYASVYLMWQQRQGQMYLFPAPPAGQTIAGNYISDYWAKSAGGAGQAKFLADTDTTYLSEQLMGLGLRWRFKKTKGLDYSEDFNTYERNKAQMMARDSGTTTIAIGGKTAYPWGVNLPEGSFGQ